MSDPEAIIDGEEQNMVTYNQEEKCPQIKAYAADMQNGVVSTCPDVFLSDKHQVNDLADIFSGRVVDDAAVNVYNSVYLGQLHQ